MPQHREAAVIRQEEELKRQCLELDNQEKEQIARFMTQAFKTRQAVNLRMALMRMSMLSELLSV